jgi:thioredoxin-related protein
MKSLFLILILHFTPVHADPPSWMNDLAAATKKAKEEKKFVLLNFSGSDWCIPCIRMHKEIFDTDGFKEMAGRKLVLVNADFPRLKKNQPSKEQQKANEAMADKYNASGKFPLTVLLDPSGRVVGSWEGYYEDGAEAFTRLVDSLTEAQ